jgi:hypothetical protein
MRGVIRIGVRIDLASGFCVARVRILRAMCNAILDLRRLAGIAIVCLLCAACSHSASSGDTSTDAGSQGSAGAAGGVQQRAVSTARPDHPSDGYRLAEIAVARLGGPSGPSAPRVTGVSVVENYGLTVYDLGQSKQELLLIKEDGKWRPLGSDAFASSGRGIVHFGLSQDLANRLIEELTPPPSQ